MKFGNNIINENTDNTISEQIDEPDNSIDIDTLAKNESNNNNKTTTTTTDNKNNTSGATYYIKVNYGAQVVTIYKKDSNGDYTVPVKAMVCSTGTATPTSGVYSIPARWEWLRLQGYVWGHYSTQIKGNILFHSVPYLRKGDPASLEYWEYDKLGTSASAGCVRLTVADAKWIYDNCSKGTKVEFYSSSNPGPLGKPSAKKISNADEELRNWDPTDPAKNNPWRNANKEITNNSDKTQNSNTQTNTINNNVTNTNSIQNNTTSTNSNNIENNITDTNSSKDNSIKNNVTTQSNTIKDNTINQNNVTKSDTTNITQNITK